MRFTLLLQRRDDGQFEASVPAFPGINEVGVTREAVIQAIERAIRTKLQNVEVIELEIPGV